MGEKTAIAWTDSTINAWHGCEKVSPGCKHCYAEVSAPVRVQRAAGLELWGGDAARSETKNWQRDLRRWNRKALVSGRDHFVFAQSLSDTFEDAHGGRVINRHGADTGNSLDWLRCEFFAIAEECSALTFQFLTKRPENVLRMVPPSWLTSWPEHIWIGATVEDQARAEERIPHLLRVPAPVRFLSVEPQIEALDLSAWMPSISWVIQGGESGPMARPFDLAWARSLKAQCASARVPYFLKQLGARPCLGSHLGADATRMFGLPLHNSHGADESQWPADLRACRAFPVH